MSIVLLKLQTLGTLAPPIQREPKEPVIDKLYINRCIA